MKEFCIKYKRQLITAVCLFIYYLFSGIYEETGSLTLIILTSLTCGFIFVWIFDYLKNKDWSQNNLKRGAISTTRSHKSKPVCPRCRSNNIEIISETHGKGVSGIKLLICLPWGLCGAGKTTTDHYWICKDCGTKFKI